MRTILLKIAFYILNRYRENREFNWLYYSLHSKKFDDFIYWTTYPLFMKYNKDESIRWKINDFIINIK